MMFIITCFHRKHPVHHWDIYTDHEAMQRCGVTNVLLSCPLQTNAKLAHYTNELLAEQVKVYLKQYKMLAALGYDDVPAALEEIAYALDDLHAVGFGLNTHNETIYLGNDCLNPIFEELNRRSALVFLHPCHNRAPGNEKLLFTGNDSVYEYTFDTTRAVMDFVFQDKVARWPNIRWIMPHAGGAIPFLAYRMSISGQWGCIHQSAEEIMAALRSFYYDLTLNGCETNYVFMKQFAGVDHLGLWQRLPILPRNYYTRQYRCIAEN